MALRAVPDHPKFAGLKRRLNVGRGEALGYLEALWHFTGRFTPQGNIGKYTDSQIEAWIEWGGQPGALIAAMIAERWIDEDPEYRLLVHDWSHHADKATRLSLCRSKLAFCTHGVPTVSPQCTDTVRTPSPQCTDGVPESGTVYGLPEPEPEPEPEPVTPLNPLTPESGVSTPKRNPAPGNVRLTDDQETWFNKLWAEYWRHEGKAKARKAFQKHVTTRDDANALWRYIQNNRERMLARDSESRPHMSTVLNQERWQDEPDPPQMALIKPNGSPGSGYVDRHAAHEQRRREMFVSLISEAMPNAQN